MKNITLILFLCFSVTTFGQKSFNKFYRQAKKEQNSRAIALPGVVFKLGAAVAKNRVKDDPVASMAVKMSKKLKGVKMLMVEDYSPTDRVEINQFVDKLKTGKKSFEDMLTFKAAGTDVHFLMRDKGDIIQNLVILFSSEEDGLVLMNMKSKLSKSEIGELVNMAIAQAKNEEYIEPEEQPKEEAKKKSESAKKEPRA